MLVAVVWVVVVVVVAMLVPCWGHAGAMLGPVGAMSGRVRGKRQKTHPKHDAQNWRPHPLFP